MEMNVNSLRLVHFGLVVPILKHWLTLLPTVAAEGLAGSLSRLEGEGPDPMCLTPVVLSDSQGKWGSGPTGHENQCQGTGGWGRN